LGSWFKAPQTKELGREVDKEKEFQKQGSVATAKKEGKVSKVS
jgi:hypothetical protein